MPRVCRPISANRALSETEPSVAHERSNPAQVLVQVALEASART